MITELDQSASDIMDRHAKSFSWAARFLAPEARRDANLLYAFARTADDLADEADLGSPEQRARALRDLSNDAVNHHHALHTLAGSVGEVLRRHHVAPGLLTHFTESLQADMGRRKITSAEQLLVFAYGVAGTVGLMMRPILGAPPKGDTSAMALGVAMQLTNVARDVLDDADRDRIYVPLADNVDAKALRHSTSQTLRCQVFAGIEGVLALAEEWYDYAHSGIELIPAENRRAIAVALVLYRAIGRKILQGGPAMYWRGRVHLSAFEKTRLIMALSVTKGKSPRAPGAAPRTERPRGFDALRHLPGFPHTG